MPGASAAHKRSAILKWTDRRASVDPKRQARACSIVLDADRVMTQFSSTFVSPDLRYPMRDIVIIGMGALGIMYGDLLARALPAGSVTVVADIGRIARYRAGEVTANGELCGFSFATPEEFLHAHKKPADLILFGVKHPALACAIETARPIVGEETVMVSVLNGISSEDEIRAALGRGRMLYSVAQQMAARREGTSVRYTDMGVLCLGVPPGQEASLAALAAFESLLEHCGIRYVHEENILRRQWCKWMFNIGINQTVMVHEATFGEAKKPGPLRDEFIAAMREVVALAQKTGVDVTERDLEEYLDILEKLPSEGIPSMRQDGLAHRKSEVEMFAGDLVRKSRAVGLEAPVNASLYARVKEIESKY